MANAKSRDRIKQNISFLFSLEPLNTLAHRLMYAAYFGGVSAMTADQYKAINGFSNEFWGWGGEDDDLYNRVKYMKMNITRYSGEVGRYTMLSHKKAKPNPKR